MQILERLISSLRDAAVFNRHDTAAPRIVLWTDAERQWEGVISRVSPFMPDLRMLDETVRDGMCGPSTWLRYQLTRRTWTQTPVIYLPGLSRQAFRNPQGFPESARHLFILQFQGQFWSQKNGKDWTPLAFFLSEEGGLGLQVSRDEATVQALSEQLDLLLQTPLERFVGRRIDAPFIHALAAGDPVRQLLQWISDPVKSRQAMGPEQWKAFRAVCRADYKLDPEKESHLSAGQQLVNAEGVWSLVWSRYAENPKSYLGVREALARYQPVDLFDPHRERMPACNQDLEDQLRQGLLQLADFPAGVARNKLKDLAGQHVPRVDWVWAELGEAPLAQAALRLQEMVAAMEAGLPGNSWAEWADSYLATAWRVDQAAWQAYAGVRHGDDQTALSVALRAVYRPWLEELGERVQRQSAAFPHKAPADARAWPPEAGTVLLFVDGLRVDLAMALAERLLDHGLEVGKAVAWSALPTVTATAKPAWRPMADGHAGHALNEEFEPQSLADGKPLRTAEFRRRLSTLGWAWIDGDAVGDPTGAGWTEAGFFDRYGHDQGARLAWRIGEELDAILRRIQDLLRAGWKKVVVLTDHGWLWLPGGLPKVDLPKHLTQARWSRCAVPRPGATHNFPQVHWYWGNEHAVVLAPGISAFTAGQEYAHGGLTLQEALTVDLIISGSGSSYHADPVIESCRWLGLRIQAQIRCAGSDVTYDLRRFAGDAESSLLTPKGSRPLDPDGAISQLLMDDDLLGQTATLVILAGDLVLCQRTVTIGES